jgi:accessory colonization factor AcfC
MTTTVSRVAAIGAFLVAQVTFACAAEIKVYATIGVKHSLEDLSAKFEKTSGHKVAITWGTGAALAKSLTQKCTNARVA